MERPILKPIGTPVEELDTPALVIDMDILEANIESVHSGFRQSEARLRPYVETHRCPAIAHRQLAAGGTVGGVAVASVGEADVLVQSGISDVLVINEVVTPAKISRLCALARQSSVTVAVDSAANVGNLSEAARSNGVTLNVILDINTGGDRSGVAPGNSALELARRICQLDALNLSGLMCLGDQGAANGTDSWNVRTQDRIRQTLETRALLEGDGIDVGTVGVSAQQPAAAAGVGGVTEVIAGAYALMDVRHGALLPELQPAARVLAAVTSLPEPGTAILDTGRKAMGTTMDFP